MGKTNLVVRAHLPRRVQLERIIHHANLAMVNFINISNEEKGDRSINIDLNVTQSNLHHCKLATAVLRHDLKVMQTNIILIQEPWTRNNNICGFGGIRNQAFYFRTSGRPSAAVYVSPNLNAIIFNQFSNDDLVVVRIRRSLEEWGDFIISSSYMPGDAHPPGPMVENLVE